ncbi:uncharacterized protein N7506_005914 [Penicillium brevicompactum]|uniref:uncharacterized protein n=1 Tax=Penicillium brevicompactum TaxID=5074 RepID=UPI00254202AC|nr:uncharacterized protein N7506_005914 [Penicillium brevicompactum]KAJ5332131.1 hypothetical protein N7506_005914 [Penicillium brevicompactum]
MVIDNIYGYNTAGRAGPSGTSVVFPLDLDQVSTIIPEEPITRQLTLSDLGTDCPQTEAESVIATAAPNGRCDPILAAPKPVKSWASPCNACGNFGLFDPPYAVAPLTGGLVPETITTSMTQPEITTTTSTSSHVDETKAPTDETTTSTDDTTTFILETSQATSEVTSSSDAPSSSSDISFSSSETPSPTTTAETVATFLATDTVSSDTMSSTIPSSLSTASELIHSSSSSPSASMSTPATAAGTNKMIGGLAWWMSCFAASVLLL